MPEKRCKRPDCERLFDVGPGELDADSVRCLHCGEKQTPPRTNAESSSMSTQVSSDSVALTITIEVSAQPEGANE
jgi:hypothetical protein